MATNYATQEPINPANGETLYLCTFIPDGVKLTAKDAIYQPHIEEFARLICSMHPVELLEKLKGI